MAKDYKTTKATNSIIPEKYKTPLCIFLLITLIFIFFREGIFTGSFWGAADNLSPQSFSTYREQPGEYPLWQPYIFSGMPGMAAMMDAAPRYWDFTIYLLHGVSHFIKDLFSSDAARVSLWYIILASGVFLFMRQFKFNRYIAFLTAIAVTFSSGIAIWIMIGHNTKPIAFMMIPYVLIMIERIKEKLSVLNIALSAIVMHIMLESGHVQMIFYAACIVFIYLITDLIGSFIKKTSTISILKSIGVLIIASGFAFLMSADKYLSLLEYESYSIRGTAPITKSINNSNSNTVNTNTNTNVSADNSKNYEYATMWSFSPEEMIDFLVPNYHGFGKVSYSGPLTGGRDTKLMTYWGQKPFEDTAPYMSALILFLALLGTISHFKKNTLVQSMTIASLFALLLSFGYTFPVLYDLFFNYFPKFSSFRAPSMILVITHFCVPVLAGFGLKYISEIREKYPELKLAPKPEKKHVYIFYASIALFLVAGIIFYAIFKTSYIENIISSKTMQSYGENVSASLSEFIWDGTISDWLSIGLFCALGAAWVHLYINKKISSAAFMIATIFIIIIDLWRVSSRPIEPVDKSIEQHPFPKTDIISFVEQDKQKTGERFRICDLSNQIVNSNAYFLIENINGYHAAKLRIYQDMLDVCCEGSTSNITNPFLWQLLNAKYIITPQELGGSVPPIFQSRQTGAFVYYNNSYCKRAYFVDSARVATPIEILEHMNSGDFNPKSLALIEKPLSSEITPANSYLAELEANYKANLESQKADGFIQESNNSNSSNNNSNYYNNKPEIQAPTVNITEYKNEYVQIKTNSNAQHLLVLSDIYYPVSWKAYIDGKETEIYKTNYVLRSVIVPAGEHTIEFKFTSNNFEKGRTLSAASNIIIIILLIIGIFFEKKSKKKNISTNI